MKKLLFIVVLLVASSVNAQTKGLALKNALVIGQLDKEEDRYSIEINVTEILSSAGVKAVPSLNVLKLGSDAQLLATDSVQKIVAAKGLDTYVIVSVRGYDRKFKLSTIKDDFKTALGAGNLFPIYREEIVSVTFEFKFFRNGQQVAADIIKCGNISDRDSVIRRLRKALAKHVEKKWK